MLHDFGFSEVPKAVMIQIPKLFQVGYVVEHPVGVTLGEGSEVRVTLKLTKEYFCIL